MATHLKPETKSDYSDAGKLNIYLDTPEVGLVSISYEAAVNEWNLDDLSLTGKQMVVPESVFRRAVQDYLKGS